VPGTRNQVSITKKAVMPNWALIGTRRRVESIKGKGNSGKVGMGKISDKKVQCSAVTHSNIKVQRGEAR